MIKKFCDGCGVELTEDIIVCILDPISMDFGFIKGIFCSICEEEAGKLSVYYKNKMLELRNECRKKLNRGMVKEIKREI